MTSAGLGALEERLRAVAFGFPGTVEDHPWGESAFKVRGKVFAFLHRDGEALKLTIKLPASHDFAELFDFAEPAGYGLGRSGWISCRLTGDEGADPDLIARWIGESWRAVAPKRLAATIPPQE